MATMTVLMRITSCNTPHVTHPRATIWGGGAEGLGANTYTSPSMHHSQKLCQTIPLCDIPSGCCSFTGPWTVTRSSLRMLRRVATFCRPLRPVLFPRSRSPVVGVLGPPPKKTAPLRVGVGVRVCPKMPKNPDLTRAVGRAQTKPHPETLGGARIFGWVLGGQRFRGRRPKRVLQAVARLQSSSDSSICSFILFDLRFRLTPIPFPVPCKTTCSGSSCSTKET